MTITGARIALTATATVTVDFTIDDGRVSFRRPADAGGSVLDLEGFLVLPGFINAHDHLEFNLFPRLGCGPYDNAKNWAADIYRPSVSPLKEHLALSKCARLTWGGLKNLLSGVTTVAHHNPVDHRILTEQFPVKVVRRFGWCHSLDFGADLCARFHATPEAWPFLLHAAEGVDEHARSEIGRLDALGVLSDRTVLIHAIGVDNGHLPLLRARRSALVWCPTSNIFTYAKTLGANVLQSGVPVALGTDSALTAHTDLIDEIGVARRTHKLAPTELFEMATTRSAGILRLTDGEGTIRQNGVADLVAVADRGQSPAEAVLEMHPQLVMVGGKPRLVSPRLLNRVRAVELAEWHPLSLEGRGIWYTDVNVPALHEETVSALGPSYRLAGRRVSL